MAHSGPPVEHAGSALSGTRTLAVLFTRPRGIGCTFRLEWLEITLADDITQRLTDHSWLPRQNT